MINNVEYVMRKSIYTLNLSPIAISDYMTGKMSGMPSISTSCLVNPYCIARMKNKENICSECFAAATQNQYKDLKQNCIDNYNLLQNVLPLELLPVFNPNIKMIRLESFGDLGSVNQAINYINICNVNKNNTFALWSKNAFLLEKAIETAGKPKNMIFIESSEKINQVKENISPIADHVFTVYNNETIEKENIKVNCGDNCCVTCGRCYKLKTVFNIIERLK